MPFDQAGEHTPHPEFTRGVEATRALLLRYLEETGLTADAARQAMAWARPGTRYGPETLTPEEMAELHAIDHGKRGITPERERELDAKAAAATEAVRADKLAELLTVDGTRYPDPWTWLQPRTTDLLDPYHPAEVALEQLARKEAERRAEEAERKLAEARKPTLRQATGAIRAMLQTGTRVANVRKRLKQLGRLTPADVEARKLFKYEPLGWAERLVIHGLASIARERGLLDAHPWALARPVDGHRADRVRLPFPGVSELARVLGYPMQEDGRVSRAHRDNIQRALESLCRVPRWIASPVLVPPRKPGGRWIEDVEVQQTLWVEASHLVVSRADYLDLHPAAVGRHLESFVTMPDLASRYEAAREAIGCRQMRDEFAIADDYARLRARAAIVGARRLVATGEGVTAGSLTVTAKASETILLETFGLEREARKRGTSHARERIAAAWDFCRAMGSVVDAARQGDMWALELPHPDGQADGEQLVLIAEETSPE